MAIASQCGEFPLPKGAACQKGRRRCTVLCIFGQRILDLGPRPNVFIPAGQELEARQVDAQLEGLCTQAAGDLLEATADRIRHSQPVQAHCSQVQL